MKQLTVQDILNADDMKKEKVEIPEWGGCVYVCSITGAEREEHGERFLDDELKPKTLSRADLRKFKRALLMQSICDVKGNRMFIPENIEGLIKKNPDIIDMLFDKAQKISGLEPDSTEEPVKNSEEIPGGDSS